MRMGVDDWATACFGSSIVPGACNRIAGVLEIFDASRGVSVGSIHEWRLERIARWPK